MKVPNMHASMHGDGARPPGRGIRRFLGSKRRRLLVAAAAAPLLAIGLAIPAMAVLAGSPSKFEANDGNMTVEGGTGFNDWNSVQSSPNYVHLADLFSTTKDDSFQSGQKQDAPCPVINTNKNPPKDDFTDVASFNETNTDSTSAQFGHTFLDGATIRVAANGNASENVELNKGTNGICAGTTNQFERSKGDKLIAIDYLNGGTSVNFHVLTWIVDASDPANATCLVKTDSPPCWGSQVQTLSANAAEGLVNQAAIAAADNKINGLALVTGQFAEFGVDLTAAGIIPANSCQAFPQTIWESRASGSSFVSSTEDVSVEHHTIGSPCTSAVSTNPQSSADNITFNNLANNASLSSGTWVRDQATVTVTGVNVWGGNVDFYLCKSTTSTLTSCSPGGSNATQIGGDVAVSNTSATATSTSTQVSTGSYCWAATFTPDTSTSTAGVPSSSSTTGECFSVTAPTSIATNPWFYPQDRATISASAGGNLAGSVSFKLFDNPTDCAADSGTVGTGGLLYQESDSVSGASPQTVDTSNSSFRVTSTTTASNLYWRVTYTSTNSNQTNSSSVCVENIGATITADGTVSFG
jgi:hypothetical protein